MARYVLKDGREFRALEDWEIRALARDAEKAQAVADRKLEQQLVLKRAGEGMSCWIRPVLGRPGETGDLFGDA